MARMPAEGHFFEDGLLEDLVLRALQGQADVPALGARRRAALVSRHAVQQHAAGGRLGQAGQESSQGGFAGAAGP
jgi:hypothetical protein